MRNRKNTVYSEADVLTAISKLETGEYTTLRAAGRAFQIPFSTLQKRMAGVQSRAIAHTHQQQLLEAEERTLIRWITSLTKTGFLASPALVIEIAEEVRRNRLQLKPASPSATNIRPLGKGWIQRFKQRHDELKSIWTRQIDRKRFDAVTIEVIKPFFDAVTELVVQHQYDPAHIYNMDESGFYVGQSQSSRALVNIREKGQQKAINRQHAWVTVIECVSAAGIAVQPMLIHNAKNTNTSWIPYETPPGWSFSASESGWTSHTLGFAWLSSHFEPLTKPAQPARRLLILDGHGSHLTAKFIKHCIDSDIDLVLLLPHTTHVLQPLDVAIFAPLKRALAAETDQLARIDRGSITRADWTATYIRARERALTTNNIIAGWRATGLWPLSPVSVFNKIVADQPAPRTPPLQPQRAGLDASLLNSSPPDGTQLRESNQVFLDELAKAESPTSPVRRYAARWSRALEATQSENTLLRHQLAEAQARLQRRQQHRTGKRIELQAKFIVSTEEVRKIAEEAEQATAARKAKKRPRNDSNHTELVIEQGEVILNVSSDSDTDTIVVRRRRLN